MQHNGFLSKHVHGGEDKDELLKPASVAVKLWKEIVDCYFV